MLVGEAFSLQFLQLLVHQPGFFEFCGQITATELESPIQSDGEGEESNNHQCLQIIAQRQFVALYQIAHCEVAIETDEQ